LHKTQQQEVKPCVSQLLFLQILTVAANRSQLAFGEHSLMCTFKPFQSVDGTSDNSSGSFGVVVKHELPAIDAQSYDSDDTCQNQEVR